MSRHRSSAGSSRFGFLIAAIVCVYAGLAIWRFLPLRSQQYEFREKTKEILKFSGVNRISTIDDMREALMKKAKEVKIPLDPKNLTVVKDGEKWHVKASWDADYRIPGYSSKIHYSVDESWTMY